jgi:pimeloyl-ACP methyl ester carboxylesterase
MNTAEPCLSRLTVGTGESARDIAMRQREGGSPGLFWLSGFNSDMAGTKAEAIDAHAAATGRACVRFDYSGHGLSGGAFTEGTISRWLEEARAVFAHACSGPQVAIGSSMGGWIALLLARALAAQGTPLHGLVLIAPAPDFTEPPSAAWRLDRRRLPGPHPAGRQGRGRAVEACLHPGAPAAGG